MAGLYYPQQHKRSLVGSKNSVSFELTPATLTSSYSNNNKILPIDYMSQLIINIQYIPGASGTGNYITMKLEFGSDGTNFFQENAELPSVGTTQQYVQERKFDNNGATVALTTYTLRIAFPIAEKFFKFSVKETVVAGSAGLIYAEAILSGK